MSIKLPTRLGNIFKTVIYDDDGEFVCDAASVSVAELIIDALNANYDPTPWCLACGAKTKLGCLCPPIAENE